MLFAVFLPTIWRCWTLFRHSCDALRLLCRRYFNDICGSDDAFNKIIMGGRGGIYCILFPFSFGSPKVKAWGLGRPEGFVSGSEPLILPLGKSDETLWGAISSPGLDSSAKLVPTRPLGLDIIETLNLRPFYFKDLLSPGLSRAGRPPPEAIWTCFWRVLTIFDDISMLFDAI